jgi:hypothetical protein
LTKLPKSIIYYHVSDRKGEGVKTTAQIIKRGEEPGMVWVIEGTTIYPIKPGRVAIFNQGEGRKVSALEVWDHWKKSDIEPGLLQTLRAQLANVSNSNINIFK